MGIAGNGMRALADVLLGWGWRLSGSDLNVAPVQSLAAAGVRLFQGHAAEHLPPETDLVVYSDAVPADNPELRRAAELGIPTLSYFQMLGRLGVGRRTVAVAGTHGKSTATAMLAHLLIAGRPRSDGRLRRHAAGATSGGRAGRGDLMLVEACEYRANFLHLRPQQAAISGIEPDHFDCYDSLEQLEGAFRRFAASVPERRIAPGAARLPVHPPGDGRAAVPRRVVRLLGRRPIGRPESRDCVGRSESRLEQRFRVRDSPVWPPVVRGAVARCRANTTC